MKYRPINVERIRLNLKRISRLVLLPLAVFCLACFCLVFVTGCGKDRVEAKYPNGKPKIIRTYGLLGGANPDNLQREQTFYFNDHKESDTYFRHGLRHGPYQEFWHNGQKKTQGQYLDGKKEGEWEAYYNQFTLSSKGLYKNDLKEGQWNSFWENGAIKSQGVFAAGKETGTWKEWTAKGESAVENSCFESNPQGRYLSYHASKTPKEDYQCRNGVPSGVYLKQDPDGKVVERGSFDAQGRKDSVWEDFHPNGKRSLLKHYKGGLENDSSYAWDEAGRLIEKAHFDTGSGERLAYDSLGHLIERRRFVKGQPDGECWLYWPKGNKRSLVTYKDGKPLEMHEWHPNGKPMAEGFFTDGHRSGVWKDWYETGVLKEISHMQDGALHGERMFYDSTGKLARTTRYEHGYPADGRIPKGLMGPGSLKAPSEPDTASPPGK